MLNILQPLVNVLRVKEVDIYSAVFKLHSKITVAVLVCFSILVSATQYFGDPIDCVTQKENKETIEKFCWIFGTYISNNYTESSVVMNISNFKGYYGNYKALNWKSSFIPTEERNYQRYYQWVPFIFAFQALLFHVPAILWKVWEGGRMRALCARIHGPVVTEEYTESTREYIIQYLSSSNTASHTLYALRFFVCEAMNFAVVILNIYFVNWIFTDFWWNYTPAMNALFNADNTHYWNTYSSRVFPKMAKCDFFYVGPSGSLQKIDALCILPLNILNEKAFAFLWLWYIILAIVSSINLAYRIFLFSCRNYRHYLLMTQARSITSDKIKFITKNGKIGEWFILYKISMNSNPLIFSEILEGLFARKLEARSDRNTREVSV